LLASFELEWELINPDTKISSLPYATQSQTNLFFAIRFERASNIYIYIYIIMELRQNALIATKFGRVENQLQPSLDGITNVTI
jgi:hypothetical protein